METKNENLLKAHAIEAKALLPIEQLQILRELKDRADSRTQEEKERDFFSTFGNFRSDKTAEELIKETYDARTFGIERESLDDK